MQYSVTSYERSDDYIINSLRTRGGIFEVNLRKTSPFKKRSIAIRNFDLIEKICQYGQQYEFHFSPPDLNFYYSSEDLIDGTTIFKDSENIRYGTFNSNYKVKGFISRIVNYKPLHTKTFFNDLEDLKTLVELVELLNDAEVNDLLLHFAFTE